VTAELAGLTDSKRLSALRREQYLSVLEAHPDVEIGVGWVDAPVIDEINILRATHRAMGEALSALEPVPAFALVDGLPVKGLPCPSRAIVKGDARSFLIAAASIVAKVLRDRHMQELDGRYPGYGFARNKGYGTHEHMRALLRHGPSPAHRRSFRPVAEFSQILMQSLMDDGE
jgi:ribonuclease HII